MAADKPPTTHKDQKPDKTKGAKVARKGAMPSYAKIKDELDSTFAAIGVAVMMTGDDYCGNVILERGAALSDSLVVLSKQNPRVRKALGAMVKTTTWTGVTMAALSIIFPVAAHHGLIPEAAAAIFLKGEPQQPGERIVVESDNGDDTGDGSKTHVGGTSGGMDVAAG